MAPVAELLAEGAAALDIPLSDALRARLSAFADLIARANRNVNLVARGLSERDLVERHLLDSLALLPLVGPLERVLDVGSGAGFPGLVLWLAAPGRALTLLEATAKRANFLHTAVRELQVRDVAVWQRRLEALSAGPRATAPDLLLSRATFPPAEWLRRGARLLPPGGRIVVMLARTGHEATTLAAAELGLRLVAEQRLTLPWSGAVRCNRVYSSSPPTLVS